MKITLAYNLRTENTEEQAELLTQEDVDRIHNALLELKHQITLVEVSGKPDEVVERLAGSTPDLIFNVAEGTVGSSREAFYPALYEQLGIPFTGGNAALLHMNLDKHLAKIVVAERGIKVPKGILVTKQVKKFKTDLNFPLMIKPNSEGSSKGITQKSIVETAEEAVETINDLLIKFPLGLIVEEFINGKEISVPFIESYPGKLLESVEHTFDLEKLNLKYNVYDYFMKQGGESSKYVYVHCPPSLNEKDNKKIKTFARKVFSIMQCPDFGRVDLRLSNDGTAYFIELNPLPSLHPNASLMTAARKHGLSYTEVIRLIIRSAAKRYNLAIRKPKIIQISETEDKYKQRPTIRELGVRIGRFQPGINNAITDVKGIKVGHFTNIKNNVKIPGIQGTSSIRTGVTAILPSGGDIFTKRLVAGGYVLNGIGEMAGLTQVLEWGWLETPILLTNSHSIGKVHSGVISYMYDKYPSLGTKTDVILPVVGETDDSFLNDVRIGTNSSQEAIKAITSAKIGPIKQGSVGAGTGMVTCDFAGGIGTSSRIINFDEKYFTIGVLVLSNFGKMRNLTIDGAVVGRELDSSFAIDSRRRKNYGSIIVVIATDVPFTSNQLCRISKRSALGIGRIGSYAASTSGEIIIAFSTANRLLRTSEKPDKFLSLKFISDIYIDPFYEAVIEATEEAILNAIFCSNGMEGRENRYAPPVPQENVLELLSGRKILNVSN
ncbi:MAG: P1 family peptidase [Cyanobacteriota bacterium]